MPLEVQPGKIYFVEGDDGSSSLQLSCAGAENRPGWHGTGDRPGRMRGAHVIWQLQRGQLRDASTGHTGPEPGAAAWSWFGATVRNVYVKRHRRCGGCAAPERRRSSETA